MFYLNINIILTILSYLCLTGFQYVIGKYQSGKSSKSDNCYLLVPNEDYKMPVPYSLDLSDPKIIYPDNNGNIILKPNESIRLTCSMNAYFHSPLLKANDILITCIKKELIEYEDKQYQFHQFKCSRVPKPKLKITNTTCQTEHGKIIEAGFNAKNVFLISYKMCFDMKNKYTMYAWYNMKAPYFMKRQKTKSRPDFMRTTVFGTDVNNAYKNQMNILGQILGSDEIAEKYIQPNKEFLTRGHLIARTEFNYAFEQLSTFFYENTAPQWFKFNEGIWKDLEKYFRRSLSKGVSQHLVVAGTYGNCMLDDKHGVEKPLFLYLPSKMKVPKLIWKIDYDFSRQYGIVFIGMNNPYKKPDSSSYICNRIPCPDMNWSYLTIHSLLYCCSLKSFEGGYGRLDPIVYKIFR